MEGAARGEWKDVERKKRWRKRSSSLDHTLTPFIPLRSVCSWSAYTWLQPYCGLEGKSEGHTHTRPAVCFATCTCVYIKMTVWDVSVTSGLQCGSVVLEQRKAQQPLVWLDIRQPLPNTQKPNAYTIGLRFKCVCVHRFVCVCVRGRGRKSSLHDLSSMQTGR